MTDAIVTDSSACLPAETSPLLTVLPITIHLPAEDIPDTADGASGPSTTPFLAATP